MISRRSDQTDRQAKQVHLTARGRRTYSKLSAAPKPLQEALLAPFSATEAEALAAQLQRAAEAMRTWEVHQ